MRVFKDLNQLPEFENSVVTIGTFDGVHLGHQSILKRLKELTIKQQAESVLLTFSPHPRTVLFPDGEPMHFLSTFAEKEARLREAGVQHLIIHTFTMELAKVSAYNYVRDILIGKLHINGMVIGHDHRFGRNREGSIKELKEWSPVLGFDVEEIVPFKIGDVTISSSKIRRAIAAGDMDTANSFLGYTYSIQSKVIHGLKLGSTELGYPTANLEIEDKSKIVPGDGIYAVYAEHEGKQYKGMMSIGMNPTVKGKGHSMEVHIFDFDQNIYDKQLSVFFSKKIRNEEKFESMDALKKQLDKDKEVSLKLLA